MKRRDLIKFLKEKEKKEEAKAFKRASLGTAMRGLDDEEELYTEADFTEKF